MRRFVEGALLTLLLAAPLGLLTLSCDSNDDDDSVRVVGTWERNAFQGVIVHLTFEDDGSWRIVVPGSSQGLQGTYRLDRNTIEVESAFCNGVADSYRVSLINGRLGFTHLTGECLNFAFQGSWGPVSS